VTRDPQSIRGWIEAELEAELPGLETHHLVVRTRGGRSPAGVRDHLRRLSDRVTGPKAVRLRLDPVPAAYRSFFRQAGADPDERRTPAEALAMRRLNDGAFLSRGRVADALTIAIAETGVALFALDADRVRGAPGLRTARDGESLEAVRDLAAGEIVLADESSALSSLFGEEARGVAARRATRSVLLVAVRVSGVPMIAVEEALWNAARVMSEPA
jgi:DNA/RNA-binding domain of Phe-tRNA-synthetase-like protein